MSNRPSDKLFDFFRSRFGAASNHDVGLPLPPDDIFDNAMIELGALEAARKKERLGVILKIAGAVVVLAIIAAVGLHLNQLNEKIKDLEGTSVENTSAELEAMLAPLEEAYASESIVKVTDDNNFADTRSSTPNKKVASQNVNHKNRSQGQKIAPRQKTLLATDTDGESANEVLNHQRDIELTQSHGERIETQELREFNNAIRIAAIEPPLLLNNGLVGKEIHRPGPDTKVKSRVSLGLFATTNASTLSMTDIPDGVPLLTGYDKFYWGGGVTVMLDFKINSRWSAIADISYSRVVNRSDLVDEYLYDSSNEGFDNAGLPMYSDILSQETPLGPQPGQMLFYTDGMKIGDGEMMNKAGSNQQALHIWSTSVGASFRLMDGEKFDLSLGTGLSLSGIAGACNEMNSELYYSGELVTSMTEQVSGRAGFNKLYGAAYGDIRALIRINKNMDFAAGMRYSRSFTSLRHAEQSQPKTYITQLIPSLGFIYKFNRSIL